MTAIDKSAGRQGTTPAADTPVRLAIVGTGGIGRVHADIASTIGAVELVGLSSLDNDAADLARSFSAPLVRDYRELLDLAPEAVLVATPNKTSM